MRAYVYGRINIPIFCALTQPKNDFNEHVNLKKELKKKKNLQINEK